MFCVGVRAPDRHMSEGRRRAAGRWLTSILMEALDWIRDQGIVLQSARGPLPNLAEWVAGEPIRGSWWGHPAGRRIFETIGSVLASGEVVATRLVNGKVTLVHRRVWPALLRLADRFPSSRLASIDEEHTETGAHRRVETQFPNWVPAEVFALAEALTDEQALSQLPKCLH